MYDATPYGKIFFQEHEQVPTVNIRDKYHCVSSRRKGNGVIQKIPEHSNLFLFHLKKLLIDFRVKNGKEREKTLICCSTYSCIHLLILVCALTRNQTCNLVYRDNALST